MLLLAAWRDRHTVLLTLSPLRGDRKYRHRIARWHSGYTQKQTTAASRGEPDTTATGRLATTAVSTAGAMIRGLVTRRNVPDSTPRMTLPQAHSTRLSRQRRRPDIARIVEWHRGARHEIVLLRYSHRIARPRGTVPARPHLIRNVGRLSWSPAPASSLLIAALILAIEVCGNDEPNHDDDAR